MSKIIHQIFLDIGLKPLEDRTDYLVNIDIIKNLNRDWEYKLWTDATLNEFVETNYPENLKYWNNFPFAMYKVDYARYMLLDYYGGIYIDLDEINIRKLDDDMLDKKLLCGKWYNKKTNAWVDLNNNIIMINDKILTKKLIDYVNTQIEEKDKTLPKSWKCRKFQHSVSQMCFTRFCKLNKLNNDLDYHKYFKTTDSENNCSWIKSIK